MVPLLARHEREALTVLPSEPLALRDALMQFFGNATLRSRASQNATLRASEFSLVNYSQNFMHAIQVLGLTR
jgi:hypothetical protein